MAQVVTPPTTGIQETTSKNWYRSEALRKVETDLLSIYSEVDNEPARRELKNAIDSIAEGRMILNPKLRPPVAKRVRTR